MRPSNRIGCAVAMFLALPGSLFAQIDGIVPQSPAAAAPQLIRPESAAPPVAGRAVAGRGSAVAPAAYQEEAPPPDELAPAQEPGVYYEEGGPFLHENWGPTCGPGGCNFCGQRSPGCGPLGNGCFSGIFVRTEYLAWAGRGMNLPPLVTTSPNGTAQANAGVLGLPTTTILFGGDTVGSDLRSGGRLTLGWWFDPCRRLGVEGDYFMLDDESTGFSATSTGNPILARPFYDVVQGVENVNLVAFPNLIQGTIAAEHVTSFQGSGVRALYNLCCGDGCGTSWFTNCGIHTGFRYDLILGYRFLRLDDNVTIIDDSTSLDTGNPGSFQVRDVFDTESQFHGADLGTTLSFCSGYFSLDLLTKVGIGNTHSIITIDGSTVITEPNLNPQVFAGGLLAQRTNIGRYEADEFAMVPELGVTVGYQLNPCWRVTAGYNFIYWSRVARAGDQIDRRVNPNLIPPEGPPAETTHLQPEFTLLYTDYWVQGLNVGLEGRW